MRGASPLSCPSGHRLRPPALFLRLSTALEAALAGRELANNRAHYASRVFIEAVAIPADSFARAAAFAISQPDDVDINEILFRPTRQVQ